LGLAIVWQLSRQKLPMVIVDKWPEILSACLSLSDRCDLEEKLLLMPNQQPMIFLVFNFNFSVNLIRLKLDRLTQGV
jgi:hypothetical protein